MQARTLALPSASALRRSASEDSILIFLCVLCVLCGALLFSPMPARTLALPSASALRRSASEDSILIFLLVLCGALFYRRMPTRGAGEKGGRRPSSIER